MNSRRGKELSTLVAPKADGDTTSNRSIAAWLVQGSGFYHLPGFHLAHQSPEQPPTANSLKQSQSLCRGRSGYPSLCGRRRDSTHGFGRASEESFRSEEHTSELQSLR